jgi:hypothetical protein
MSFVAPFLVGFCLALTCFVSGYVARFLAYLSPHEGPGTLRHSRIRLYVIISPCPLCVLSLRLLTNGVYSPRCRQWHLRTWSLCPAHRCPVTLPTRLWCHGWGTVRETRFYTVFCSLYLYIHAVGSRCHSFWMSTLGLANLHPIALTKVTQFMPGPPHFSSQACPQRLQGRSQFRELTLLDPDPRLT